jgi:hypothetical protein
LWTGCVWFKMGPVAVCCGHGNEPSCSIKGREFLDQMCDC